MKNNLNLLVLISSIVFSGVLNAESESMKVALATSQCVYIDGEKECTNNIQPYKNLDFKLVKNANGKYFSYKEVSAYIGTDEFKVTFTVVKDSLESAEILVRLNLITETSLGEKKSKVVELLVSNLSDLEDLRFDGDPIIRVVMGYLTETGHSISFY